MVFKMVAWAILGSYSGFPEYTGGIHVIKLLLVPLPPPPTTPAPASPLPAINLPFVTGVSAKNLER